MRLVLLYVTLILVALILSIILSYGMFQVCRPNDVWLWSTMMGFESDGCDR